MAPTKQTQRIIAGFSGRRAVVVALAISGIAIPLVAVNTAGAATKSVVISTTKTSNGAKVLVSGNTLYTLKASSTPCAATCLKVWPALVLPKGASKATAGSSVSASKLGTKKLSGGILQVTYSGKPLYLFSGDTASGQANGNVTDKWGKWSDVTAKKAASTSSSGGSSSGGSSSGGGVGF
jgi:predicted lipoprotein with Yx(FWY)xxD motif